MAKIRAACLNKAERFIHGVRIAHNPENSDTWYEALRRGPWPFFHRGPEKVRKEDGGANRAFGCGGRLESPPSPRPRRQRLSSATAQPRGRVAVPSDRRQSPSQTNRGPCWGGRPKRIRSGTCALHWSYNFHSNPRANGRVSGSAPAAQLRPSRSRRCAPRRRRKRLHSS